MVATLSDLPSNISLKRIHYAGNFLYTAEIYSQFPARQKISWELGSQVPKENPAMENSIYIIIVKYIVV